MAVVNIKSTEITAADLLTGKKAKPLVAGARLLTKAATVEVAAADTNASTYRFMRVKSDWGVRQLLLWNDAIASGSDFDFGLYKNAADGGAVVDVDYFASAVSMTSARATPLDITYEAATTASAAGDIDRVEKAIWEILALSADPFLWYDIVATANHVGSAAGTLSLVGYFAVPN